MSGIFKKCQCLGQEDFTPNSSYNLTTNLSNVTNANILAISSSSNKHIISAGNKLKLELQHQGLEDLPSYYLLYDRVLEELHLESNNLVAIPKIIAYFTHLRYLNLAENEINVLNSSLGELKHLSELDVSKNNVTCVHDAVAKCNNLKILNFSVNPLKILPDPISKLESLTQLYLNETQLDDIPEALGNLNKLKILELRENNLTSLPKSLCMMTILERLDIGNNNFTELPDVIGTLFSLKELWCDLNELTTIPSFIGCLKSLECLDACRNKIFSISNDVSGCSMLTDLHVSFNHLKEIPESLCQLNRLEMVKIDSNQLTKLPDRPLNSERIVELILTNNCLAKLPSWISRLKQMHILNIDDNLLDELPKEIGECSGLSILSCRNNRLNRLPDELGSLTNLKVLNLCDNKLKRLPITLLKLTNITALWLAKNQAIPLIPLQVDYDVAIKKQYLTCVLLPQKETEEPSLASTEDNKDGTLTTEDGSKDSVCNKKLKSRVTFDLVANGPNGNGIWERLNNKFIKDRVASSELAVGPKLNSTAAPRTELKSILNFPKMSSNIALNPSIIASNGIDFTQEKTMTQSNTPLNNMFNNNDNNWNTENTKYTSKLNYDESYDLSHFINGGQQKQQQYEIRNNNFKTSYQAPSSLSLQGQASHQSAVPPIITYNLSNSSGYSSDGEITRHNISTMINNSINNNNSDNVNGNYLDSHLINGNYVTNNNATYKLLSSNGLKVECSECRKKIHNYTVTLGNNPQRLADIEERSEKASPLKLQLSPKSSSDHQMLIDNGQTKVNLSHLSTGPINNWHTQQQKVVKPPYIRNSLTITDISEYTNHLAKPLLSNTSSVHARFAHHLEQRGGQNNLGGNIHCNIGKNEGNAIHSNYDLFNYGKMGTSSSNRVDDKAFILNKFLADGNTGNNSKNNQACMKIHNGINDKTKPIHHSSRVRILDPINQGNINSNNNVNHASILSPPALRGYHSDSERIKLEKRALIGQSINERIQQLQLANMNKEMPPIRRSNSFKNDRIDFVTFLGPHGNNGGQSNLQTGDICHGRSLSYSYQPNLYDSRYVPTALTCLQGVIRDSHEPFQDSYKNDKSDKYLQHAAKYPHKKCLLHKHQETLKECPLHAKKCNKNNFNTTTAFRPDSSSSNTSSSQGCKDNSCSGPPNNHPINITNVTVKKSFRDRFSFLKHKKKDMDKAKIDKRGKCNVNTTTDNPDIVTSKNKQDLFSQQQSCARIQKLQSPLIKSRKKCPIHSKEYGIDPKMIDKLNKCDYHTGELEDEMNRYIPRAVDITPDYIIGRDQQYHNYDPNNKNLYGNMMEESVSIKHEYQSGIILDILLAKRQNELGFSIIGGNTGVYAENEGSNTNGKNKMCTHHLTENNLGKNNPKNLNLNGIRVNKILHNGPADKSLMPGDLILAVNGINFDDMEHENAVKVLKATGNIVKLTIFRNNTC